MSSYQDRINNYVSGLSSQSNAFDLAMGSAKEAAQNALMDKIGAHADYMAQVGGIVSGASLGAHGAMKGVEGLHKALQGYRARKQAKMTGGNEPENSSVNSPKMEDANLQDLQASLRQPAKPEEDESIEKATELAESKKGIRQNLGGEEEEEGEEASKPLFTPDEDAPLLSREEAGDRPIGETLDDILRQAPPDIIKEEGGKLVPTSLQQTAEQQGLSTDIKAGDNPFSLSNFVDPDAGGSAKPALSAVQKAAQVANPGEGAGPGSGKAAQLLADVTKQQPPAAASQPAQAARPPPALAADDDEKTEFDLPDTEGDLLQSMTKVQKPAVPAPPQTAEGEAFAGRSGLPSGVDDLFTVKPGDTASSIVNKVQGAVGDKTAQLTKVVESGGEDVSNALQSGSTQALKSGAETLAKQAGEKIGGSILGEGVTAVAGAAAEFVPVVGELAGIGMLIKNLVEAHKQKTEAEEKPPQAAAFQEQAGGFDAEAMLKGTSSGVAAMV